jgi:hypothetical protein
MQRTSSCPPGDPPGARGRGAGGARERRVLRRATSVESGKGSRISIEELVDVTGVGGELIKELEDWRLIQPETIEGRKFYDDTDREIVKACADLARFGVGGAT